MKRVVIYVLVLINLCVAEQGAKYLIITNDIFYNAIQPLANWKTKKGVKAKVVPLSITGNSPAQIKNYIFNAYNYWTIRPEYILLVGSGMRLPNVGSSDDYYVDLTGIGNPLIELRVGRFPCMYLRQCSTMVAKTLSYERTSFLSDTTWYRKGTTIVDDDYEADSVYWADVRYIHSLWQNDNYLHIDSLSYFRGDSLRQVMNAINDGRAFIAYRGLATVNWWHFPINPENLNNSSKLPIVISGTCATMSLSDSGYLGDKFLTAGSVLNPKGAVGFFGTTIATSGPGLGRLRGTVATGFFHAVFQESIYKLGDATKRAKFIIDSIRPPYYIDTRYKEWNLFGDPELPLYTYVPKPLTVIHDTVIQTGPQTYTITVRQSGNPVANTLVCVMMDSTIYQYGYTNSTGNISFVIYTPYPGTMSVTVTARNCTPYEKNVSILPGGNVHDVSVVSVVSPQSPVVTGSPIIPKVLVRNWGGYSDTFSITFKIDNVYQNTIAMVVLNANDTATIAFPVWNATVGSYTVTAYTMLTSDQWRANDTFRVQVSVITPNDVGIEAILNPDTLHSLNRVTIPRAIVKNYGILPQNNFPVVCSIFGASSLLRYSNFKTIVLAGGQDTTVSFSPWTPITIETCIVKISTQLAGDENPANNSKIRYIRITADYLENLEEGYGGYRTSPLMNGWKWGVPNAGPYLAHSGTKCWATGLIGNYPINANWKLTSPEFIANMDNPVLKFWHWYAMDDYYDGGNVKISLDSGVNWTLLHPQNGYPGFVYYFNVAIPNESCYTGISDWTEVSFTLPVLSGQHFFVRWHFGSSPYFSGPGWYIDDIIGIGFLGQTPYANDVSVDSVLCPTSTLPLNVFIQPATLVRNCGILGQDNFPVSCSIVNTNGVLRYSNTRNVSLEPGRDTIIYFMDWLPTTTEICRVKMNTLLNGDENLINDYKITESEVRWILFEEGFEEPYFPPNGWVVYNNDGGTQNWIRGTSNPHNGSACAESRFENTSLRNDDWLVTSSANVPTNHAELRFWFRAHNASNFETLEVRLSNTGNAITDFTVLLDQFRFNNTIYQERAIAINGYTGQNVYIAFINKGLYQRKTYIDDVMIKGFTEGITEDALANKSFLTMLYPLKPNPNSNGLIRIYLSLAEPTITALKIYDISGRIVKTLVNKPLGRGVYNFVWSGENENNQQVPEGVYFYTLQTDKYNSTKKLILTR